MQATNLGASVLAERNRFKNVQTAVPDRPGHGRYLEINGESSIQGFASDDSAREQGFLVNIGDGVQIDYESKQSVITRTIMYHKRDNSDPKMGKLETWHRSTVVREDTGELLGDQAVHSTAVYPDNADGHGFLVSQESLEQLPLSQKQHANLTVWNIAH
ncbi:hypothetical protein IV102_13910 [bacterium]|nr:hypothetical protein [bacterium]